MSLAQYVREDDYFLRIRKTKKKRVATSLVIFLGSLIGLLVFFVFPRLTKGAIKSPIAGEPEVRGAVTRIAYIPYAFLFPSSTPTPTPTPLPSPTPVAPKKSSYVIAAYGDSMVDTMGENLDYLYKHLKKKHPKITFKLNNYGKGGENAGDGLGRFDNLFKYQQRDYPSISEIDPDFIILGSFSYNPFSPHDRGRHREQLEQLIKRSKQTGAQVYLLAEIAPLRSDFGKGPNGVNWDSQTAFEHSGRIIEQLEDTIQLAKKENVQLINAYAKSLKTSGNIKQGDRNLVNPSDGIHPSIEGHDFTANLIIEALKL